MFSYQLNFSVLVSFVFSVCTFVQYTYCMLSFNQSIFRVTLG